MLLLVGLGNPGAKYAGNRHNIGFMAVDAIAHAHKFGPWKKKFRGEVCEGAIDGVRALILKPQTYYNDSGHAVAEAAPVKIRVEQPKVPILQTGAMNLKVITERVGDFKGVIELALLYSPPGLASAGTFKIEEGKNEAVVPFSAKGDAPLQKWKVCVVGSAPTANGSRDSELGSTSSPMPDTTATAR